MFKIVEEYGIHLVSSDGGTWYLQACEFLKLHHHIHSFYEKNLIERTTQYVKDRIEIFDYFPCKKNKCTLTHVKQWLHLFIDQHNEEIMS
ncbi:MAG TPA: hypothetical protein VIY08_15280 [Candidatus Nitrosocosmicus sp.]